MKGSFSYKNHLEYIFLTLALIVVYWSLSLFEVFSVTGTDNIVLVILYKLLNDIWTGILSALAFFPIYFLFIFIRKSIAVIITQVIFCLLVIIQLSLIKYSLTTQLNLGADFFGYSMSDIFITVSSSESISFLYFIPFILLPVLFLGIYYGLKKWLSPKQKSFFTGLLIVGICIGILRFFVSGFSEPNNQNKVYFFISDTLRIQEDQNQINAADIFYKKEYPLMRSSAQIKDVLSPFFETTKEKPNIVIIIVEGLGIDFIDNNSFCGFTPYLDSLIPNSLYWENFLSNTGRTFGVLPSLLGSLPYGEKGFLELNPLPSHLSIISILKANGYSTSYYSGDDSAFDRRINFLQYHTIDNVVDVNKFGPEYVKTPANSGGFSWGYPDAEIFKKTLSGLGQIKTPRLDIIMTLANHEPFNFPSKNKYLVKVDSILNSNKNFGRSKSEIKKNRDIFACLLYTDNSIKNFMSEYSKRPEYKNTIFIITGDHRLIPIKQKDNLSRFHVPLWISSPMLKKPAIFQSISSHWDVTPSLLSFLNTNYEMAKLPETSWMGDGLDTARQFRNVHKIPLMRYKGSISDFVYKDYMLSDGRLYRINKNMEITAVKDPKMLETLTDSLKEFKRLNAYLTQKNKIFPQKLNKYTRASRIFSKNETVTLQKLTKGLNPDQIYFLARKKALNKEYPTALLLCDYILNDIPNYADTGILKGRIYAWSGDYIKAEDELLRVNQGNPFYYDSYSALMDVYKWDDKNDKAIKIGKKALRNKIVNVEISYKLAEIYRSMENYKSAEKIIDSIIKVYPDNKDYLLLKKSLKK